MVILLGQVTSPQRYDIFSSISLLVICGRFEVRILMKLFWLSNLLLCNIREVTLTYCLLPFYQRSCWVQAHCRARRSVLLQHAPNLPRGESRLNFSRCPRQKHALKPEMTGRKGEPTLSSLLSSALSDNLLFHSLTFFLPSLIL